MVSKFGSRTMSTVALPHDRKVISYLQREFDRHILTRPHWKVLPKNKRLRRSELVNLFRCRYWRLWEKEWDRGVSPWWDGVRIERLRLLLSNFKSMLIRYGFHGFGNPEDDMGIVVFAEDRLSLTEVVASFVPPSVNPWDRMETVSRRFRDVEEVRADFKRNGSAQARELAERVRAVTSTSGRDRGHHAGGKCKCRSLPNRSHIDTNFTGYAAGLHAPMRLGEVDKGIGLFNNRFDFTVLDQL